MEVDPKTSMCNSNRSDCKLAKQNREKSDKKQQLKVTYIVNTRDDDKPLEIRTIKTACCIIGNDPKYWAASDNEEKFANWIKQHLNVTEFDLQLRIWGSKNFPRVDLRGVLNYVDDASCPASLALFVDKCFQLESAVALSSNNEDDANE